MANELPTIVEWHDGTTRQYTGYDIEVTGGILLLTDTGVRRPVIIPLECIRECMVGGTVLVTS